MTRPRIYYRHKPRLTKMENHYKKKLIAAVRTNLTSRYLVQKISACAMPISHDPIIISRCRHVLCPDCRWERKNARAGRARDRLKDVPKESIYSLTVVFDARRSLYADPYDLAAPIDVPTRATPDDLKALLAGFAQDLQGYKDALFLAFTRPGSKNPKKDPPGAPDAFYYEGAIEVSFKTYFRTGKNIGRFIESFQALKDPGRLRSGTLFLSTHCHFAVAARRDGRYLTMDEVTELLRGSFPLPSQVKAYRLKKHQDQDFAVKRVVGYASKGHIGAHTPDRFVRQMAVAFDVLGRDRLRLSRSKGKI